MPSFGEELRRERELRGIPLRDVSEATKISLRHLQALESDEFEHLPGGVFNRGFVRAYAQFIGVDPDAMVDAYLLEEQSQAAGGKAADRDSFHRPREGFDRGAVPGKPAAAAPGRRRIGPLLWVVAILVILAGAAAVAWFGFGWPPGRNAASPAAQQSAPPTEAPR